MEIEKIRSWSYYRQKLDRSGASVLDVLDEVPGIYSPHPSGPLSLAARTENISKETYESAEEEVKMVRMPAMRGTVHLLPTKDARKYTSACLPLPDDPVWEKRYSQKGRTIPKDKYPDWIKKILDFTSEPRSTSEISEACDIPKDIIKPVVNRMGYEKRLLRVHAGSLRSNKLSYVNAKKWTGWSGPAPAVAHSQLWLCNKYFKAYGPATMEDFYWWSGIKPSDFPWEIDELEISELGNGLLLSSDLHIDFENWEKKIEDIAILPQWDSYVMGYAPNGRERLIKEEKLSSLYGKIGATGGNGRPCILIDGIVRAIWKSKFSGKKMNIEIDVFQKVSKQNRSVIEERFNEIGDLMEATKIEIKWN